nr:MAG TPA: Protein of unknown function (DUF1269) [Caudoviricetes sp.]
MNSFSGTKDENQILNDSGRTYTQGLGFGYVRQNDVDRDAQMKELSKENTSNTLKTTASGAALGASVGSIFPGVGTVIGGAVGAIGGFLTGLFGSKKRKRELRRRM